MEYSINKIIKPNINKDNHQIVNMVNYDDVSNGSDESKEEEECNVKTKDIKRGILNPTSIHKNEVTSSSKKTFNYNYVNQLKNTLTNISIYELNLTSNKHSLTLFKILNKQYVDPKIQTSAFVGMVYCFK